MFTGSADHPTWDEESTTSVAISRPLPRARWRDDSYGPDRTDELDQAVLDQIGGLRHPEDDWMGQAACKGRTSVFFGIAGERPERRVRRERTARSLCAECEVVEPCRARARAGRENGFWGGESEEERAAAGFAPRSISRRSVQQAAAEREAS